MTTKVKPPETKVARFKRFGGWLVHTGWAPTLAALLLATFLIWWWPGLEPPPVSGNYPHTLYFLSAIAQSLAAVLALVFTLSLIAAQMSSSYSSRILSTFLDPLTVGYMLLFTLAVLMPMWLLANEQPALWTLRVSATLTSWVLFLLVPYFLSLPKKLSPEALIATLRKKSLEHWGTNPANEPAEVAAIDNLCMNALVRRDYDTFHKGVQALASIALETSKSTKDSVGKGVFYRLMYIGVSTLEDQIAPLRVLTTLRDAGLTAADRNMDVAVNWSLFPQSEIGKRAVKKNLEHHVEQAVVGLSEVGQKAAELHLGSALLAVAGLGAIGYEVDSAQPPWDQLASGVVLAMGFIASKALDTGLEDQDTKRMVWELARVAEKVCRYPLENAVIEASCRLWVLGAQATMQGRNGTVEEVHIAVDSLGELQNEWLQVGYIRAKEVVADHELKQCLIKFRGSLGSLR